MRQALEALAHGKGKTPFTASHQSTYLGSFATAEEAALTAACATPGTMTADEAKAAAEKEGLTLARSDKNATGTVARVAPVASLSVASAYVDKRRWRYLAASGRRRRQRCCARAVAGKEQGHAAAREAGGDRRQL